MFYRNSCFALLFASLVSFNIFSNPIDRIKPVVQNSVNALYQQVVIPAVDALLQTPAGAHLIGAALASYSFVTGKYPFSDCQLTRSQSAGLLAVHGSVATLSLIVDGQWTMQDDIMHAERSYNLINESR